MDNKPIYKSFAFFILVLVVFVALGAQPTAILIEKRTNTGTYYRIKNITNNTLFCEINGRFFKLPPKKTTVWLRKPKTLNWYCE